MVHRRTYQEMDSMSETILHRTARFLLWQVFPTKKKEWHALKHWLKRKAIEGELTNEN
jgi:hypothetical protein